MNLPGNETDNIELFRLCTLSDPYKADIVRACLLDHDLPCELENAHQAGFAGIFQIGIMIRKSDMEEATEILREHFPEML